MLPAMLAQKAAIQRVLAFISCRPKKTTCEGRIGSTQRAGVTRDGPPASARGGYRQPAMVSGSPRHIMQHAGIASLPHVPPVAQEEVQAEEGDGQGGVLGRGRGLAHEPERRRLQHLEWNPNEREHVVWWRPLWLLQGLVPAVLVSRDLGRWGRE